jgi:dihydrofolate synthase/folylpolyglutamate synthase
VVVTGTNGKGSTVSMIETILLAAGLRVGAYTSPHLLEMNERIRVQGKPIDASLLSEALTQIEQIAKDIPLSFFQAMTFAALQLFHRSDCDILILEVGIGGRLDPVNMVDADIAVITSVAIDHVAWLGNDREAIGSEKAGIFRDSIPVVCGDLDPPQSVLAAAAHRKSPVYRLGKEFGLSESNHPDRWTWYNTDHRLENLPQPRLHLQNAAVALQVISLLAPQFSIHATAIVSGLQASFLPGRLQLIPGDIEHFFDVAHNPAAAMLLAKTLLENPCSGRLLAVCGMLDDKDHVGTLRPLQHHIAAWFLADLEAPRGEKAAVLAQALKETGQIYLYPNVTAAYRAAFAEARSGDRILVFGSFRTVAAVMKERASL